ncbi:maleylacetoacetate isomerase [Folsomia candida]|nr:maleylacetoacetate isomerase [Folsomia candida]
MSKPILYNYFRSSSSWRVRIVLAHKGIDYEYKAINLLKKEQLTEEYRKICPMQQVPALEVDGKIITQSMAIMDFLEDLYPEIPMIPKDRFGKAKVKEISDIINSGIQPLQNLSVILKFSSVPDERTEWARFWIAKGLDALEIILSETKGKYCVGDQITIADACLYPQIAAAERFKVEMEKYPIVNEIYQNLGELPAFKAAHAFVQPDCPEDLRVK